jgi:hypothetical protein
VLTNRSVCIASIVRIVNLNDLIHATDITYTMGPVFVWSCVEPYVGILCACLPTYAPLVRMFWNKMRGKSLDHDSKYNSNTGALNSTNALNSKAQKAGYRLSMKPSSWNRLGDSNSRLRNDDELELTNNISGGESGKHQSLKGKDSHEEVGFPIRGIMVKNDVTWSTSPTTDEKAGGVL